MKCKRVVQVMGVAAILIIAGLMGVIYTNHETHSLNSNSNQVSIGRVFDLNAFAASEKSSINSTTLKYLIEWYGSMSAQSSQYSDGNKLLGIEHRMFGEFCLWYFDGSGKAPIDNSTLPLLYSEFIQSNTAYNSQIKELVDLESGSSLVNQANVTPASSTWNSSNDPSVAFETHHVGWGWFIVEADYYYYVQYTGINALYNEEGIEAELRQVNFLVSLNVGLGATIGGMVIAALIAVAEATTVIGALIGIIGGVITYLELEQNIQNLENVFHSTYDNYNYFSTVFKQTVVIGVSNSMEGWGWNGNTGSWQDIYGPAPGFPGANWMTDFNSAVQYGVNTYGQDNWVYVNQVVDPPT